VYETKEGKKMTVLKGNNVDQLCQIYNEMNEAGKEKLIEMSKQILNIWNTVNEEKPGLESNLNVFEFKGEGGAD
jgi:hypothetical protein